MYVCMYVRPAISDHKKQHCRNKRSMITPEAWTPVIINSQCSSIKWIERSTKYVLPRIQVCTYVPIYVRTYVCTYVRSVNHVTSKRKEGHHILRVWGSVTRALRAQGSPAIIPMCTHQAFFLPIRNLFQILHIRRLHLDCLEHTTETRFMIEIKLCSQILFALVPRPSPS